MKMHSRFILYSTALSFSFAALCADAALAAKETAASAPVISNADAAALMKALQEQAERLNAQEKKLAEQEKNLEDQKRNLMNERIEFEKLQTKFISVTGRPLPAMAGAAKKSGDAVKKSGSGSATPAEVGTVHKEQKEKPPEIAAVIDEGGVLTQAGKLVVTPALEYSHSSVTSVAISGFSIIPAINIGLFDISQTNRDMLTPSVGLRYGVTNRFELETKIPYVFRKDSSLQRPVGVPNAPEVLSSVEGNDLGDVEVAGHYQINDGKEGWPFLIGNLRFKSATGTSPFEVPIVAGQATELPTGSGFYAIQPSVTAIFPTDPLVYYGNLGYLHNFGRSFANYGKVEPGDGISGSFGMSLSLNDKSSISTGYSHTMVLKTMVNGQPLANSDVLQVGALDLGFSYNYNETTNLNFTVSAGLTADAPDVRLIFRVPMTFDLDE